MAPSFGRSISFPLSPSRSSKPAGGMASSYHARSVSLPLPCRSHPILAHLHTHIRAVRAWASQQDHHHPGGITASASSGLAHVDALHAALADLLDLPEAQAALGAAAGAHHHDRLLDAFLRLADAHGSFQEALLDLKRDVAEALAAIRRRDGARLASALRSQRRAGKELARLAVAAAKDGAACRPSRLGGGSSAAEVEVTGLLAEAAAATASASAALFSTIAAMSASASAAACSCKRTAALMCLVNKKVPEELAEKKETCMALVERLEELEECIDHLESSTDKVFRSLVHTRVALLNVHTNIF